MDEENDVESTDRRLVSRGFGRLLVGVSIASLAIAGILAWRAREAHRELGELRSTAWQGVTDTSLHAASDALSRAAVVGLVLGIVLLATGFFALRRARNEHASR